MKKSVKPVIRVLRIIMPTVALACVVTLPPQAGIGAWRAPLPNTVQQLSRHGQTGHRLCHPVEWNGCRILVDCGLLQGGHEQERANHETVADGRAHGRPGCDDAGFRASAA